MTSEGAGIEYLHETEHAVRHLFEGLSYYEGLLRGLTPPSQASSRRQLEQYVFQAGEYFGLSMSRAVLCGAILETAYVAINAFPHNLTIPPVCQGFVRPGDRAVRFCIGREVHGLSIGVLIYAGRNQHVHWEDESFDAPTSAVFEQLFSVYKSNPLFDMAYVLNWPERFSKAHHVVQNELNRTGITRGRVR